MASRRWGAAGFVIACGHVDGAALSDISRGNWSRAPRVGAGRVRRAAAPRRAGGAGGSRSEPASGCGRRVRPDGVGRDDQRRAGGRHRGNARGLAPAAPLTRASRDEDAVGWCRARRLGVDALRPDTMPDPSPSSTVCAARELHRRVSGVHVGQVRASRSTSQDALGNLQRVPGTAGGQLGQRWPRAELNRGHLVVGKALSSWIRC